MTHAESISKAQTTSPSSRMGGFPNSNSETRIWKKVISIGGQPPALVVVVHESIVEQLGIDEDSWVEEIPMTDGIYQKLSEEIPR